MKIKIAIINLFVIWSKYNITMDVIVGKNLNDFRNI